MQEDWDQGIAELAQLICRLCISPSQQDVLKKKISLKNFQGNSDNSFFSRNVEESKMDQRHSSFTTSNFDNLEDLLQNAERDED